MKKILLFCVLSVFAFSNLIAQDATISIPNLTAVAGSEISVPVNITTLSQCASFYVKVKYDPTVMSVVLDGNGKPVFENPSISGLSTGISGNVITISRYVTPAFDLDGKLFDLKFDYIGGTAPIEFNIVEITYIDNGYKVYSVAEIDGSIATQGAPPAEIRLNNVNGIAGDTVSVDISGGLLENIGSMNLNIEYDNTKVSYIGIGDTNIAGFVDNASAGLLKLAMINGTGFNLVEGILASVKFEIINGTSPLTILGTSEVIDINLSSVSVIYTNGSITELPNQAPSFVKTLPDTTIGENDVLTFLYTGNDPENRPLTFALVSGPTGANLGGDGNFTWTPSYNQAGVYDIYVRLTDGAVTVYDTSIVTVTATNRAPKFVNTLPDTTIIELQGLTYLYTGEDLDDDLLTFALVSGPTGATLGGDGSFTWTPSYNQAGVYDIYVSLTDGTEMVYDTSHVTVTATNRAPNFINTLSDTTISELESLTYLYSGEDLDDDLLTFALVSGPTGATLGGDGSFSWTPTYDQAGVYDIYVSLTDGIETVYDTCQVTVTDANRAPNFVNTLSDTTIAELEAFTFQYTAFDPDGDLLTFALQSGPDGATVTDNGLFNWTPATPEDIVATIIVSLTDQITTVYDTTEISVLTDIGNLASDIPEEFSLAQNYPNPFNPSTTISFALPQQANVKLSVYNAIGEEVAQLIHREMNAGFQSVNFDASHLSSGLYFYRISAGNFVDVKKMLLLK
jgi:hypothetical protein